MHASEGNLVTIAAPLIIVTEERIKPEGVRKKDSLISGGSEAYWRTDRRVEGPHADVIIWLHTVNIDRIIEPYGRQLHGSDFVVSSGVCRVDSTIRTRHDCVKDALGLVDYGSVIIDNSELG